MKVIGIAGGTGSGKTTLVRRIVEGLPDGIVAVIPQDSYYKDLSHIPFDKRRDSNFDHPDAFDWELFRKQVDELRAGKAIEQPIYSYVTSTRAAETLHVDPCEVIIIEGIMALHDARLREMMDLKVFVDAPADERLLRVIVRDIAERDMALDALVEKYRKRIRPMHDEFIEPMKAYADVVVSTAGDTSAAIDLIRTYITKSNSL